MTKYRGEATAYISDIWKQTYLATRDTKEEAWEAIQNAFTEIDQGTKVHLTLSELLDSGEEIVLETKLITIKDGK